MSAMRLRPDLDPPGADPAAGGGRDGDDGAPRPAGGMPGGMPGGVPGQRGAAAEPLPRFGGRLAGLGPLGAPPAGEMPGGDMNGGIASLLADVESGADALDQPPPEGEAMPTGAMDDAGDEAASQAMHATMNEGRAEMPTGAMSNGDGGAMPHAGSLRRREDPDAGGELRRPMPADDGGELGADPGDAGAGGMPTADMHRAPTPDAATSSATAAAAARLAIGGEWRLTLSSISLGRT